MEHYFPNVGDEVLILAGQHAGEIGLVLAEDLSEYSAYTVETSDAVTHYAPNEIGPLLNAVVVIDHVL